MKQCRHWQRKSRKPGAIHIFCLVIIMTIVQCSSHNADADLNQGKTCPRDQFYSEKLEHCTECTTVIEDCEREDPRDKEMCKNSCRKVEPSTTKPPTRTSPTETTSTTTKTSVKNNINRTNKPKPRSSKDKDRILFGAICGSLLGMILIFHVLYWIRRKCPRARRPPQTQAPPIPMNVLRLQVPAWTERVREGRSEEPGYEVTSTPQERIIHGETLSIIGSSLSLSGQSEAEI